MITEQDLQEAIAECQGQRNPTANTCIKLAAFYTIRNELFGGSTPAPEPVPAYSYAAPPDVEPEISINSDTEFAQLINGRNPDEIWPIMDELMTALHMMQPRLYDGVMRKLA